MDWFDLRILWVLAALDTATTFYLLSLPGYRETFIASKALLNVGRVAYTAVRLYALWKVSLDAAVIAAQEHGFLMLWAVSIPGLYAVISNGRLIYQGSK